ncbi:MAG: transposase [Rhizobiales bacterium]|nr:transposase [Hyphomicrobiales bacterium]
MRGGEALQLSLNRAVEGRGIVLHPDDPAWRQLELKFIAAQRKAFDGIKARLDGDTVPTPLHLDEIARTVKRGAHAVLLLDRAGWHTTGALAIPKNITMILLPSRAPELNPVENIWQYLRQNCLSNRVFDTYEDIIDAACHAWRKLIAPARDNHLNRIP